MPMLEHDEQPLEEWRAGVMTRMRVSSINGAHQLCIFDQWCEPGLGAPTHLHAVEEVLEVNGSTGDRDRRVHITANTTVTVAVSSPSTNPTTGNPTNFAVWGRLGSIQQSDAIPTSIGTFTMGVFPFVIGPEFFVLADTFVPGNGLVGATPAPWILTLPAGLGAPLNLALTGIIEDASAPSGFAVMNTVRVAVR